MADEIEGQIKLPIQWNLPDGLTSHYATNIVVQRGEHEFIISFFEVIPPIALGTREERMAQLKDQESVKAECVARVIIAAEKMPGFIEALQENLGSYRARPTEPQEEEQSNE